MSFQIHALRPQDFQHLFALTDDDLTRHNARRVRVSTNPGFPCRISLEDANIGEKVILTHYEHLPESSPYKASHAIFIRDGVEQAFSEPGVIPISISLRLISVRAFDLGHNIINADVVKGTDLAPSINNMFADEAVSYIHLHNAKPGCYAAKVTRA